MAFNSPLVGHVESVHQTALWQPQVCKVGGVKSTGDKAVWRKHACTHIQYLLMHLPNRLEEKAAVKRKENMKAGVDRPTQGPRGCYAQPPGLPPIPKACSDFSICPALSWRSFSPLGAAGKNASPRQGSGLCVGPQLRRVKTDNTVTTAKELK